MILDVDNGTMCSGRWVREVRLYIVMFNETYVRLI